LLSNVNHLFFTQTYNLLNQRSYHSKYNPIERCWGILEEHWNGTLLNTIDTVLEWAKTMTWKGIKPVVKLCDKIYEKGVKPRLQWDHDFFWSEVD
jgi:transposase